MSVMHLIKIRFKKIIYFKQTSLKIHNIIHVNQHLCFSKSPSNAYYNFFNFVLIFNFGVCLSDSIQYHFAWLVMFGVVHSI